MQRGQLADDARGKEQTGVNVERVHKRCAVVAQRGGLVAQADARVRKPKGLRKRTSPQAAASSFALRALLLAQAPGDGLVGSSAAR